MAKKSKFLCFLNALSIVNIIFAHIYININPILWLK